MSTSITPSSNSSSKIVALDTALRTVTNGTLNIDTLVTFSPNKCYRITIIGTKTAAQSPSFEIFLNDGSGTYTSISPNNSNGGLTAADNHCSQFVITPSRTATSANCFSAYAAAAGTFIQALCNKALTFNFTAVTKIRITLTAGAAATITTESILVEELGL